MRYKCVIWLLIGWMLTGCNGLDYDNPVPSVPVQININLRTGMFVQLAPENINNYLVVDLDGFHLNKEGTFLPRTEAEIVGYAGVVIYVDNNQRHSAFDLCCPKCLDKLHPCYIDGIFAVCPKCDEHYDLSWGLAFPSRNISRQPLRRYTTLYTGDQLSVRN